MFENIMKFFKKINKKNEKVVTNSRDAAKERLHLVLMQDRANVSADFLELMKQEIIEVIKKYIDIDEKSIDVHLTNKTNDDGTVGAPALYANIPIVTIKNEARIANVPQEKKDNAKVESEKKETEKANKNEEKVESANQVVEENKTKSEDSSQIEEVLEEAKEIQNEVEKEQAEKEKNEDKELENAEITGRAEESEKAKDIENEKGETKEIETKKEEQNVGESD